MQKRGFLCSTRIPDKIMENNMSVEECWFVYGFKFLNLYIGFLKYHSIGSAAEVDFDWEKVLASKNLIGWCHSHPDHFEVASGTDHKTMRSWVRTLEKSLICCIKCKTTIKGHVCYIFRRNKKTIENQKVKSILIHNLLICQHLTQL